MKIHVFLFFGLPSPLGPHKKTLIHSIDGFLMVVDQIFWKNHKKNIWARRKLWHPQLWHPHLGHSANFKYSAPQAFHPQLWHPHLWHPRVWHPRKMECHCNLWIIKHQASNSKHRASNIKHPTYKES